MLELYDTITSREISVKKHTKVINCHKYLLARVPNYGTPLWLKGLWYDHLMLHEIRCISGCCSYTIFDSLKGNLFNVSIYVFWQKPPYPEKGHFTSPTGSYQRTNAHNSSSFANFWTNKNVKINQRKPQRSPLRFTLLLTWDEIIHLTTSWFGFQPISPLNRCRKLKDQNTRPNLYTWNLYLDKLLPYWRTSINLKFKFTTCFLFWFWSVRFNYFSDCY